MQNDYNVYFQLSSFINTRNSYFDITNSDVVTKQEKNEKEKSYNVTFVNKVKGNEAGYVFIGKRDEGQLLEILKKQI